MNLNKKTMTRLEKQIEECNLLIKFSEDKVKAFQSVENEFAKILKSYGVTEYDANLNSFVDKSIVDDSLIFRMYVKVDLKHLSPLQRKNLQKKLKVIVSIPFSSSVSEHSISIYYK